MVAVSSPQALSQRARILKLVGRCEEARRDYLALKAAGKEVELADKEVLVGGRPRLFCEWDCVLWLQSMVDALIPFLTG